jgi:hypothetical protein
MGSRSIIIYTILERENCIFSRSNIIFFLFQKLFLFSFDDDSEPLCDPYCEYVVFIVPVCLEQVGCRTRIVDTCGEDGINLTGIKLIKGICEIIDTIGQFLE